MITNKKNGATWLFIIWSFFCMNNVFGQNNYEEAMSAPNSYITVSGQNVHIAVRKAYAVWNTIPELKDTQPDLSGEVSAELLWQDKQSLIQNITVQNSEENAVILVAVNNTQIEGNALIAVKIGDVIRWSWHVWVTTYNPEEDNIVCVEGNNNITFMKYNLGALISENDKSGLFYQFGRNTPFIGANNVVWKQNYNNIFRTVYDINNNPIDKNNFKVTTVKGVANLSNAVQQVLNFYLGTETNAFEWASTTNHIDTLWVNANGKKGIFDPSPAGWRVPAANEYNFLFNAGKTETFIYTGSRDYSDASLFMTGKQGMYWSSTPNNELAHYAFISDELVSPVSSHYRANAYAIRCVKENSSVSGISDLSVSSVFAYSVDRQIIVGGLPEKEPVLLQLYNTQGYLIETKRMMIASTTIGQQLSKGLYILKISGENNQVFKIIVN